jgi:hypothetical protein
MSFLDSAAGALDTASNILGDKQSPSAAEADSTVTYYKGDFIGNLPDGTGGAQAPFDLRVQDTGAPIELIHFGWVHRDYSTYFGHENSITDTTDAKLPQNPAMPGSRGIMYRGALERETILLGGFVDRCQQIMEDRDSAEGSALQQLAGVVDDMLGSGGDSSSSVPKATDLNAVNGKVKGIGQTLNSTNPVAYAVTHQAGEDLHQARANYRAVLTKLRTPPPPKKGILSDIGAVAGALPIAGDIFNLIQGIATMVFDIYIGVYAELAWHSEPAIEKGCHDLSIAAIQGNQSPIFPPWFIKEDGSSAGPDDTDSSEPPLLAMGTDQSGPGLGDQLKQAPEKLKNAGEDAGARALHDFLATPTDGFWAQQYVTAALAPDATKPAKDQPPPTPPSVGSLASQAFQKVLGITVPQIALDIISEIMETDEEFLGAIYLVLMCRDNGMPIAERDVYAAARTRLLQKFVDLAVSKLAFLQNAQKSVDDFSILKPPKGKEVKGDEALKKASTFAMDELSDKLAAGIDPILKFAIGSLAKELENYRSVGASNNAMTMEIYLGRLPYLRALLFRNTFFPIWDLLVNQVFGNMGGPIQQFLNSSGAFFKGAKGPLDDVRDKVHRAKAVKDTWDKDQNVAVGTGGNIGDYTSAWNSGGVSDDDSDPQKQKVQQDFPLPGRSNSAAGKIIKQAEWKSVTLIADPKFGDFPPKDAPPQAATPAPASGLSALKSLF